MAEYRDVPFDIEVAIMGFIDKGHDKLTYGVVRPVFAGDCLTCNELAVIVSYQRTLDRYTSGVYRFHNSTTEDLSTPSSMVHQIRFIRSKCMRTPNGNRFQVPGLDSF